MVQEDDDGPIWVLAESVCGWGDKCRYAKHGPTSPLLGLDVSCKMVRYWADNSRFRIRRTRVEGVPGESRTATWYRFDDLRRAERLTRESGGVRPRTKLA